MHTTRTIAIILAGALALTGCAASPGPQLPVRPSASPVAVEAPAEPVLPPVTFAPAGDSITAWTQVTDGTPIGTTWPTYAQADDLVLVPGFAAGGFKIADIAANTPACSCDVVVVMAGTNDMSTPRWATPLGERSESLVRIVVQSGAAHALILAVPPINIGGPWVDEWNAELQRLATFYGWNFFDPWAQFRTPENAFVPGSNFDNAHPTPESQAIAGALIHDVILELVR